MSSRFVPSLPAFFLILIVVHVLLNVCSRLLESRRYQSVDEDLATLQGCLQEYFELGRVYPSEEQGLSALIARPTTNPLPDQWVQSMDEIPIDSWGTAYQYRFPGIRNPRRPDVISAGPDREFGTADDLSNQD
jgi:general secretion pathway protein G